MTDHTTDNSADPTAFVRVAWSMVKRGPLTVVLRLVGDFATNVVVWALFTVALVGAVLALLVGPSPEIVVGVSGCLAAGLGLFLAIDAVVMGTVWTHAVRTATDRPNSRSATGSVLEGLSRFGETLLLRGFNFASRLAIIALFCSWAIPLAVLVTRSGGIFGSPVVLPALVVGGAATVYALAGGLVAMTVELVAPAYFLGGRSLGGAIREAAEMVVARPLYIYRIFVTALGVLLPALALAWGASIAYALTFENPELAPFTGLLRGVANLVLFGAIGLFVVMLQYSFFAFYAHTMGRLTSFPPKFLDAKARDEEPVPIERMIPKKLAHALSLSEVIEASRSERPDFVGAGPAPAALTDPSGRADESVAEATPREPEEEPEPPDES